MSSCPLDQRHLRIPCLKDCDYFRAQPMSWQGFPEQDMLHSSELLMKIVDGCRHAAAEGDVIGIAGLHIPQIPLHLP